MAASMFYRLSRTLNNVENSIGALIWRLFPPGGPGLSLAGIEAPTFASPSLGPYEDDIRSRSILNTTPRNRRSIERRLKNRYGSKEYINKMLWFKKNLQSCVQCGHWHEPGVLCPHCYKIVIDETKEIRQKIEDTLQLEPVEKDVIVLYENDQPNPELVQGKRVVEMEKPRPTWFSNNLMQPTTQEVNEKVKDLKPSELA